MIHIDYFDDLFMVPTFFEIASHILSPASVKQKSSKQPVPKLKILNNLGGGDCAVYAFILGELHLAINYQKTSFVNKWKQLDSGISQVLDQALTLEVDSTLAMNRNLMDPLKDSMRGILKDLYLRAIPADLELSFNYYTRVGRANIVYEEFNRLCQWAKCELHPTLPRSPDLTSILMNTNLLFAYGNEGEEFYKNLAKKVVRTFDALKVNKERYPSEDLLFDKLVFAALTAHHKRFLSTYERIITQPSWLTDAQINQLADIFDDVIVIGNNFQRSTNQKQFNHLLNQGNFHWVTLLYDANYPYPKQIQSLQSQFSESLDSVGYLTLQRFMQSRELINEVLSSDFPQISDVYDGLQQKLTDLFHIVGVENLPELIQTCVEQEATAPRELRNMIFKNILISKIDEQKQQFLNFLAGDRSYVLLSNVVEAKNKCDQNPEDLQLQNELNIEKLRLLCEIDKENLATYQQQLDECIAIRWRSTETEKEEILALQESLKTPSILPLRSPDLAQSSSPPYFMSQRKQLSQYFDEDNDSDVEDSDDEADCTSLDDVEIQRFPFHILKGAVGGGAVGIAIAIAIGTSLAHITIPALLIIATSAIVGIIVAGLIKLYSDAQYHLGSPYIGL